MGHCDAETQRKQKISVSPRRRFSESVLVDAAASYLDREDERRESESVDRCLPEETFPLRQMRSV